MQKVQLKMGAWPVTYLIQLLDNNHDHSTITE